MFSWHGIKIKQQQANRGIHYSRTKTVQRRWGSLVLARITYHVAGTAFFASHILRLLCAARHLKILKCTLRDTNQSCQYVINHNDNALKNVG